MGMKCENCAVWRAISHHNSNNGYWFTLEVSRYAKPLIIGSYHIAALGTMVITAITIIDMINLHSYYN